MAWPKKKIINGVENALAPVVEFTTPVSDERINQTGYLREGRQLTRLPTRIVFVPLSVAATTGIIIWLYLLRGSPFRAFGTILSYEPFLGIERQMWVDAHMYFGLLFTALVVVHLALHWSYIKDLPGHLVRGTGKGETGILRAETTDVADTQE